MIIEYGTSIGESWSGSHPAGHPQQHSDLAANIQVNCSLTHFMIIFHSRYDHVMMNTITIISDTHEMEDMLADFLKVDALISAMEEKLEVM